MSLEKEQINIKVEKEPIELNDYCFKRIIKNEIKSEPSESLLLLNNLSCMKTEDPVFKEDLLIKEEYHDEPFEYGCIHQDANIHLHNKSVTESTAPLPGRSLGRKSRIILQESEKESTPKELRKREELQKRFNIGEKIKAHDTDTG